MSMLKFLECLALYLVHKTKKISVLEGYKQKLTHLDISYMIVLCCRPPPLLVNSLTVISRFPLILYIIKNYLILGDVFS